MKNKVDKSKVISRMIIACWVVLFLCFVFKIFSNGLFEIMVNNEGFINFTTYIDSRIWLQTLVYLPYVVIGNTLLLLAIIGEKGKNKKTILIVIGAVLIEYAVRTLILCFLPNYYPTINICLDTALIVLVPYAFNRNMMCCITGHLINLGIQSMSLLIRNLGIKIILMDSFTSMILAFDVILMYVLFYLYTNFKSGGVKNGTNS